MTAPTAEATGRTRSQQLMALAVRHVRAVQAQGEAVAKAYGGWCHRAPGLILANGLCQTVAFLEDKARDAETQRVSSQMKACRLLRAHVAELLGIADAGGLTDAVSGAPLSAYLHQTRTLLAALVYYKRFAVSLLGVQPGDEPSEDHS